jgi:GTP-binding protein LepA
MKNQVINFSIIAHIDHGKSTLADQILNITGGVASGFTDSLELEKERGITIKSKAIRVFYTQENTEYQLNMVDTPGHSDFSYEVSKALYACDYAILLVDATKGVQAQTVSNAYKAIEQDLDLIPVINKIDVAAADVSKTTDELVSTFGFSKDSIFKVSAKSGEGVENLLRELIKMHKKKNNVESKTKNVRALIFDSFFDSFTGVNIFALVDGGHFKKNDTVVLSSNNHEFTISDIGYMAPKKTSVSALNDHEVGFMVTGLKSLSTVRVGDTLYKKGQKADPFPGFKEVKPLVYLGIFSRDARDNDTLRKGLDILNLKDSAFTFEPESLGTLGFGFRCGFLGVLHADIVVESLKREFGIDVTVTTPSVPYLIKTKGGAEVQISSPRDFPDPSSIEYIREPVVSVTTIVPSDYLGKVMELLQQSRAEVTSVETSSSVSSLVLVKAEAPLAEIILDFNDRLKSMTSGMGSFDYEFLEYRKSDIVKLDILVAGESFDPLSTLVHSSKADYLGRLIIGKLKDELARKQFAIALQASVGGKIIARETIKAYRKDVTAKLYGGDRTRKDKLLKKQKKGKKRMDQEGKIEISKDTFLRVIKTYG